MPGIPDQSIAAKVEFAVKCQAEFDDAQIGGEVGRPGREQIAQDVADLGGNGFQLLMRKVFQRQRALQTRQQRMFFVIQNLHSKGSLIQSDLYGQ
jgi:hypothetical protein